MFIDYDDNVPQTRLEVPGVKVVSACLRLVPQGTWHTVGFLIFFDELVNS